MANPFLIDDDLNEPPTENESVANPFFTEEPTNELNWNSDNPFMIKSNNPFATELEDEPDIYMEPTVETDDGADRNTTTTSQFHFNDNPSEIAIDSAMSFFGTTIEDDDMVVETKFTDGDNLSKRTSVVMEPSETDEGNDRKQPPPRPVPPSKTTQDLILSVADHLDQTSNHLLDRIPITRTPSPVSMRDLHSPSPTPEINDLMDVSDLPEDVDTELINKDDGFGVPMYDNPFQSSIQEKRVPNRPAPPTRPIQPPRPTPPQRPSPPNLPHDPDQNVIKTTVGPPPRPSQPVQDADLFDMFDMGTKVDAKPKQPPPPKSTQDILNLFTAQQPKQLVPNAEPTDLLSGDIPINDNFGMPVMSDSTISSGGGNFMFTGIQYTKNVEPQQPSVQEVHIPPVDHLEHMSTEPIPLDDGHSDSNSEVHVNVNLTPENEIPTEIEAVSVNPQTPEIPTDNISSTGDVLDLNVPDEMDLRPSPSDVSVNPFMSDENLTDTITTTVVRNEDLVRDMEPVQAISPVPPVPPPPVRVAPPPPPARVVSDEFDAFTAKFDSVKKDNASPFMVDSDRDIFNEIPSNFSDAWGNDTDIVPSNADGFDDGFGADEGFDSFLNMGPPMNIPTISRTDSRDSDDDREFNVVIRPREDDVPSIGRTAPILAPPPRNSQSNSICSGDSSPRFNPFDKSDEMYIAEGVSAALPTETAPMERSDSQETPPTPLFDDDVSQPLEDFPRVNFHGTGWEMQLRQPNKKKITGQRFWKKILLKMTHQGDNPVLQLFNAEKDKDPFQELPLQACYSVSEISAQQFDQFGKIFTIKLQYIFYKERPGVRPGQVTKAERLTNKLSQFAAYAIQGDYQGVKEFASDMKKLGLPVEHAPQVSQLFKIGSHTYEDLKQFSVCIEEQLFKFNVHRDRALNYKSEEIQVTAVDELYVEQDDEGRILKQIARVRLFLLAFLSGMPTIELGVNDLWRQGKEVVGRHDIIPVVTEEWIRLEGVEFHQCVQQNEYERSRTIRFQPPDACYIELMRFRVRPPKNRELPLQLKATWCVTGNKVELRADVLVPGFASRKLGQIPCEDVAIRFPIPECWIYLFRVEKHFRYGSVKSAHRRTGKIKGIERILGTVDQLQESLIEVTSGQAKYEHHHRAIVWRCPRLPKEGQGAYTTHQLVVRMALTSYDQIPDKLAPYCFVEFTMPATQVSHVTVRSISVQDSDSDDPPEKYVRYLARHEYRVGIEHTQGESTNAYLAATTVKREPIKEEPVVTHPAIIESASDSDSN